MPESVASLRERVSKLTNAELVALGDDSRAGVRALVAVERRRRRRRTAEAERLEAMLEHEREHWRAGVERVAGVDEAGAGPWAGPVVAGAVILPPGETLWGLNDSKQLNAQTRDRLAAEIRARAVAWAVGISSAEEIDTINIKEATRLAMRRAVDGLAVPPEHVLVDWRQIPDLTVPQTVMVRGDARSHSVAAASVLAKTHRDRLMAEAARTYPGYGFESHVGYGTAAHRAAIEKLGACPLHRRSFKPVARALGLPVDTPAKKRGRRK